MTDIQTLTQKIIEFRNARDWKQFHNPKDMAISLVLEANEVLEHFQWKDAIEMEEHLKNKKEEIGEELSDVLYWVLLMAHDFNIDISKAFLRKAEISNKKYPVDKAKGSNKKYNEL